MFPLFPFNGFRMESQLHYSLAIVFNEKENDNDTNRDPPPPDNHLDARAVRRRAYRLRAWPLEALWQKRRRVPQGGSPGPLAGRRHGRLGRHMGTPALRLVRSQPRRPK